MLCMACARNARSEPVCESHILSDWFHDPDTLTPLELLQQTWKLSTCMRIQFKWTVLRRAQPRRTSTKMAYSPGRMYVIGKKS